MATTTWTGQSGDNAFGNAANWSAGLPSSTTDVAMRGRPGSPPTITLATGAFTARTLTMTDITLSITGGSLTLLQASRLSALSISGGTLDLNQAGAANAVTTATAVTLGFYGVLALDAGNCSIAGASSLGGLVTGHGTVTTAGAASLDGLIVDEGSTLRNQGTATVSTNFLDLGQGDPGSATFINDAGAVLEIANGFGVGFAGAGTGDVQNAGLFENTGDTTALVLTAFASTGTVAVGRGGLLFANDTVSLAGAVTGGGTLTLNNTTATIAAGTTLSVGGLAVVSGTLTLGRGIAFSGDFTAVDATLQFNADIATAAIVSIEGSTFGLNGHRYVITYQSGDSLLGSEVTDGMLVTRGTADVSGFTVDESATLVNDGTQTVNGNTLTLGLGDPGLATLRNDAGAVFRIEDGAVSVGPSGNGSITSAGVFEQIGTGTAVVDASFASTGTVAVGLGTLQFQDCAVALGEAVSGAGTLAFSTAIVTIAAGTALAVGGLSATESTVTFGAGVRFAGALVALAADLTFNADQNETATVNVQYSTIDLHGHTATVAGRVADSFYSSIVTDGTLVTTGTADVSGLFIDEGSALENKGTEVANGSFVPLTLGLGDAGTAALINDAGAVFAITGGSGIALGAAGTAGGSIFNAGVLENADGNSGSVSARVDNAGTLLAAGGTLAISGAVVDEGFLAAAGNATLALSGGGRIGDTIGGGTLALSGAAAFDSYGTIVIGTSVQTSAAVAAGPGLLAFVGPVANDGTIVAGGDWLTFSRSVSGSGTVAIDAGRTAIFYAGSASGQRVAFLAPGGRLTLKDPASFAGTIRGFAHGDTIDLLRSVASSESFAGGTLTLAAHGNPVASLHLAGAFTTESFALASDGHGGTVIMHV